MVFAMAFFMGAAMGVGRAAKAWACRCAGARAGAPPREEGQGVPGTDHAPPAVKALPLKTEGHEKAAKFPGGRSQQAHAPELLKTMQELYTKVYKSLNEIYNVDDTERIIADQFIMEFDALEKRIENLVISSMKERMSWVDSQEV